MILKMFALRDRKTDSYANPMFLISAAQAVRSLTDAVGDAAKDNVLYQHPEDFELFEFGTFDTTAGVFVILPSPLSVVALDALRVRN